MNRIPSSRLLISSIPGSTLRTHVESLRNRYNQVPHLTQDTNGEVTISQLNTTNGCTLFASIAMSTSVLKALPDKLDIKRHSPSMFYVYVPSMCINKRQQCHRHTCTVYIASRVCFTIAKYQSSISSLLATSQKFNQVFVFQISIP